MTTSATGNPNASSRIAAILLAAGQSRRMGTFKPLLPFGQKSVIRSCVDYLYSGGVDDVVVVLGNGGERVREDLKSVAVHYAVNPLPGSEMGHSIACGVRVLPATAAATLIALVDYPAVPSSVVSAMIQGWREGASLVIPTWMNRGGHPVLIDLSFRQQLLNLDSDKGLKALFEKNRARVTRLAVNSPYVARDMDTWDDYLRLHEDVFGLPPAGQG